MTGINYNSQVNMLVPPTEDNHLIRLKDLKSKSCYSYNGLLPHLPGEIVDDIKVVDIQDFGGNTIKAEDIILGKTILFDTEGTSGIVLDFVDSPNNTTLEAVISAFRGIDDAQKNNKLYGRRNGEWETIENLPGTNIFPVTSTTTTSPAGARVNDLILNASTANITVGTVTGITPGTLRKITTLAPLATNAAGNIRGVQGIQGIQGYSNYELALQTGFIGDELAWLKTLKASNGVQGTIMEQGLFPITLFEKTVQGFRRNEDGTGDHILVTTPSGRYNLIPFPNVQI